MNHPSSLAIDNLLQHLSDELAVGAAETEDLGSGNDVHGLQDQLVEPRLVHLYLIRQEALLIVALARPPKLLDSYTQKQGSDWLLLSLHTLGIAAYPTQLGEAETTESKIAD